MKHLGLLFPLLAATTVARVELMVPLYAYPGNDVASPSWQATFDAIAAHPDMHFYLIVNPNSGPTNGATLPTGYNEDFTTNVARLNAFPNVQTLGYVSTTYNNGTRTADQINSDVDNWAKWRTQRSWLDPVGNNTNITIHGIFFDETSAKPEDRGFYADLVDHADAAFNADWRGQYSRVFNVGVNITNLDAERALYDLVDVVVSRETCWSEPSRANEDACGTNYTPFRADTLMSSGGLPNNRDLYSKASILVHYVQASPEATNATLRDQIYQTVQFGIHSLYFTSARLWETTVQEPATIGAVAQFVDEAQSMSTYRMT